VCGVCWLGVNCGVEVKSVWYCVKMDCVRRWKVCLHVVQTEKSILSGVLFVPHSVGVWCILGATCTQYSSYVHGFNACVSHQFEHTHQ